MKMNFNRLSKPELEHLIENCNFKEDEISVLKMSCYGNTVVEIALTLNIATDTVSRRKRAIRQKIFNYLEVAEYMTTVYINGKHMTEEEIKNQELKNKQIKNIILEKLTSTK